jgi:hypothetical protein
LYTQLQEQPWWVTLPFLFTVFGGGVGALLELGLLVTGTPFQLLRSRFTRFVTHIRLLNIAPVLTTIFFFVCSFCLEDAGLRTALLYASGFAAFALAPALYYGGANATVPLVILATQVLQIVLVVATGLLHSAYQTVGLFLIAQSITQAIAYLITTQTPLKSTGFHVLSTLSGYLLFLAAVEALQVNPGLLQERTTPITGDPLLLGGFVAVCLAGYAFTMKTSAMTYNIWRSKASNVIWSLQYFLLISAKRFPNPKNLSELYKKGAPLPSKLKPYYQQQPEYLPEALIIPAVERIEGNVTAFGTLVQKAKSAFKLIAMLDHVFPQADSTVPLKLKPRMNIWSDGSDICPTLFTKTIFGTSLPIPHFKITPPPAIDAYKEGQLLAYLAIIHMTYNLLEVVFHNAFDAQGQFNHPFRTFMYIHLFSHELAEELTTEHLVQEGAVFTQIFATTHDSLINHLNDEYHRFEYAADEDFEYRQEIMKMDNGKLLPGVCISWELEYAKIWQEYTDALIDTIYPDDKAVQNDKYLQDMSRGLKQVYLNGLPKRYADLQTKAGLSRWASDTIHHLTVRHQVYGTTGINSAMDPRISSPQVPKDGGTPGIDEWRSLVCVGLATACARFTLCLARTMRPSFTCSTGWILSTTRAWPRLLRICTTDW